jgi:transcriptional regulator with XRE-family HTH domain
MDSRPLSVRKALKALRHELGWTQAQLARLLDITPAALGNYEQGNREPSADTLWELSRIAGEYKLLPEKAEQIQSAFVTAFMNEVAGTEGPATAEERAWSNAVIALIRRGALPLDIRQKIVELLEARPIKHVFISHFCSDPLELKLSNARSAQEKLSVLVSEYMARTSQSEPQAYAAVLTEHPSLAARIKAEMEWEKARKDAEGRLS